MNTTTKKTFYSGVILARLIKSRKLKKVDVANHLSVSYDTLRKYLKQPETMDGSSRQLLAEIVSVPIDYIDDVCNGKVSEESPLPVKY